MSCSGPVLKQLLARRSARGKEDPARLSERMGTPARLRPDGPLIWLHAASVGEAQSALILIDALLEAYPGLNILVTTGTVTSAELMEKRLPARAFHQYVPLDHPGWVSHFLNHWTPDAALWMESELWPNMLMAIQSRAIPCALINARLSDASYTRWKRLPGLARNILKSFQIILTQTDKDAQRYTSLGAQKAMATDNLKYSAPPLPYIEEDLNTLSKATHNRPLWVYASSHAGEEELAARVHMDLAEEFPDLLTIIVPRHPHRGVEIEDQLTIMGVTATRRTSDKTPPAHSTDIYIADTLGEMGLFYRLGKIVFVGRSFSHDGGGGHNLIEPAQLECTVLTGPNVQFQQQILDDMLDQDALLQVKTQTHLTGALRQLFSEPDYLQSQVEKAGAFARQKTHIIETVMTQLKPVLAALPQIKDKAA